MKKWKKGIAAALVPAMLFVMAGCGKGSEEAAQAQPEEEYVYVAEYRNLDQDGYGAGDAAFGKDGRMFYIVSGEKGRRLFTLTIGEGEPAEIPVRAGGNTVLTGLGTDMEGNALVCLVTYKEPVADLIQQGAEGTVEKVILQKLAADGSGRMLEELDITDSVASQKEFYIQKLAVDKDGNYYVCTDKTVFVIYPDGRLLCEINEDNYISSINFIRGEKMIIGTMADIGWKMQEWNVTSKNLTDLECSIPLEYGTYQEGTDTDLIYTQGSILYSCNLKDDAPTKILDWVDSDIDSNNLRNYRILEDGTIAAFSVTYSDTGVSGELAVLTKKPRSEVPQKTVLTYGTVYLPYFSNQDIVAFNKQSDSYRIEVRNYGDDNMEMSEKMSLLKADIASGKGPDIIDLYVGSSFEEYVSSGVLEDLTPFLENDKELKREDFLENILAQYEVDGKLYAIIPNFGIETIVGKVSDVGEEKSWTVKDMIALADSKGQDAELLPYSSRDYILSTMCMLNRDFFVNPETGECYFTGEGFKEILEFAKRFPKEVNYDGNGSTQIEKVRNGQLTLINAGLTSVQLYQMYEYMFGEPVNFIGYPIAPSTDSRTPGSGNMVMTNGTTVGMNANSENKEGVWEFIRFNLTKERQENMQSANGGFPILKSALDKQLEEDMTAEYYEDTDGTQKEKSKGVWGTGDFSVDIYAATQEQADRVREIIASVQVGVRPDDKMFEIIDEEAQAFFEDQKSVEDVAALIQSRVQNYVNEQR